MKLTYILAAAGVLAFGMAIRKATPASELAVSAIARAIGTAEGFFKPGARPQRNNNPGNLTMNIGAAPKAVGRDGMYLVYLTAEDGWTALEEQVRMMLDGRSRIYNRELTIAQVAQKWTTTDQAPWARIVSGELGVSPDTKLKDIAMPGAA